MHNFHRSLQILGVFSYKHPFKISFLCLIFAIASMFGAIKLHVDTNILSLLPQDSPIVKDMMETMQNFHSFDRLFIVISDKGKNEEDRIFRLEEMSNKIANSLSKNKSIKSVLYRRKTGQLKKFLYWFLPRLTRYVPPQQIETIIKHFNPEQINAAIRRDRLLLLTQTNSEIKSLVTIDPLGFNLELRKIFPKISEMAAFGGFDPESEYFLSKDGLHLLMIVQPTFPAQKVEQSKDLLIAINNSIISVKKNWQEKLIPKINIAGGPAIAVSDEKYIRKDLQMTIITSLIGVLLLFQFAFRNKFSPLIVVLPLFLGILNTLGFAAILLGHLNILSSIFAAILIGLGIDFSIHFFHRYRFERQKTSAEKAIQITYGETGSSIVIGALTTSTAFLSITITDFRGLRELGLIAGIGIIFTLINVILLFPILIRFSEKYSKVKFESNDNYLFWHKIETLIIKFRIPLIVSTLFFSVALFFFIIFTGGIPYETDLSQIRPDESPVWTTQRLVGETFLWKGEPIMIIFRGETISETMEKVRKIDKILDQFFRENLISNYVSLSSFIPNPNYWKENKNFVSDVSFSDFKTTFSAALKKQGFKLAYFTHSLSLIEQLIYSPPSISMKSLSENLGADVLDAFFHKNPNEYTIITHVYFDMSSKREQNILAVVKKLDGKFKGVSVAGMQRVIPEFKRIIQKDFWKASFAAALTVIFILLLSLRKPLYVIFALLPLSLGILWTLAIMKFLGLSINFMNVVVTPMLIGIGIDDGIHLVNHFKIQNLKLNQDKRNNNDLLAIPGKGIILTSLTTIIGFGSLSLAHYPGLRWIGLLTVIGVAFCLLFSITFLPAVLSFLNNKS